MFTVSHKQGELFYLRMLLLDIKGAQSWEDLLRDKDDSNIVYESFEKAADKRGKFYLKLIIFIFRSIG